jgi:mannitol/fructose-specific phosphotransferase system IIA component (Ntr-type)
MPSLLKVQSFADFVDASRIVFSLQATEKVQAIEELLDLLLKQKVITNEKLILTRLIDREGLESTAIGEHIALPHARVDTGGKIVVAIGRSAKGIDFKALDKKKVRLIILVLWNPALPGLFNHLFAGLARFLHKPEYLARLFAAKNKPALLKVLSEIDLSFPGEDRIISPASLLYKLQEIDLKMKKAPKEQLRELQAHDQLIREELDENLLTRYDKLMERYGFAVAEVVEGACQSCNMRLATQMSSAIEGSNDIFVCENCGKFLVAPRKKKSSGQPTDRKR